jgi:hypothetical protein
MCQTDRVRRASVELDNNNIDRKRHADWPSPDETRRACVSSVMVYWLDGVYMFVCAHLKCSLPIASDEKLDCVCQRKFGTVYTPTVAVELKLAGRLARFGATPS